MACGLLATPRTEAFAESPAEPPAKLPRLEIEDTPLRHDDVTVRPYIAGPATWSHRSIATLKDALGQAPGLLLQESFGGFEPPRLSIRGSGLQSAPSSRGVQFLLDGFPLTLADGSFNAALIDPTLVGRADVLHGAAAAELAPAAMGGAINLRSPLRGMGISPVMSLRAETGSFGTARGLLTGHATHRDMALTAAGSFSRMNGYREHSAQSRRGVFAQVLRPGDATPSSRALGQRTDTSVSIYHLRADYEVPGPLTLAAAAADPRAISADVRRDRPRRISSLTQATAQVAHNDSDSTVEAGLSWLHSDDAFRQLRANGLSDSQSDDLTFRATLSRQFGLADHDSRIHVGTTVSRGWRDLRRFRNDSGATGPLFGEDGLDATTAVVDVEATVALRSDVIATAGLSGLASRRDISDRLRADSGDATTRAMHSSAVQPRAQLRWTPRSDLTFFLAAARAIEPPTFDDLLIVTGTYPNLSRRSQSLSDQRATTFELGASGSHGPFGWDVTTYHGRWTNEILRLADAQGLPRGAVNAGPTRHRGIEAAFHWQILDGAHRLRLTATATWSRFTFDDDPLFDRNRLAGAPPHVGTAQLLYEHPRGFFASTAIDWTAGPIPVDHANRMTYGGHALTHLRFGWRPNPRPAPGQCQLIDDIRPVAARAPGPAGWLVFVEVRNLFDRAHIASTAGVLDVARNPAATAVFLPGVGRAITIGIEWNVFAARKPGS